MTKTERIQKFMICLLAFCASSAGLNATLANAQTLAFPSADGYGRFSTGGRGGSVCKVTVLDTPANMGNSGTLWYCLQQAQTRSNTTIIFDVAGVFEWNDRYDPIDNVNGLTIAGQTAPGSFYVRRGQLNFHSANDVIIRYVSVRPGKTLSNPSSGGGIKLYKCQDCVVDNSSVAFASDDSVGSGGSAGGNVTFQDNLIGLGLQNPSGAYSKCGNMGGRADKKVSFLRNACVDFADRYPLHEGTIQLHNNVIAGNQGAMNCRAKNMVTKCSIRNNYFAQGKNFAGTKVRLIRGKYSSSSFAYVNGNVHSTLAPTGTEPQSNFVVTSGEGTVEIPWSTVNDATGISVPERGLLTAQRARDWVIANAGNVFSTPYARRTHDPVDQKMIDMITSGGRTCGHANKLGCTTQPLPYPSLPTIYRESNWDTDNDGIPNTWESNEGLDPSNAADAQQTALNGYSNLENYLSWIVGEYQQSTSAVPSTPTGVKLVSNSHESHR